MNLITYAYIATLVRDGTPAEGTIVAPSPDQARAWLENAGEDSLRDIKIEREPTIEDKAVQAPTPVAEAEYVEAGEENTGFCLACKKFTTSMCEPDARNYTCEECRLPVVFGAEEALMQGFITFTEEAR